MSELVTVDTQSFVFDARRSTGMCSSASFGTKLPFQPRDRGQGFNSVLRTTHRQNFLVPPRRHRSFPLVELLA